MSPLVLVLVAVCVESAPLPPHPRELEPLIQGFLEDLYERLHRKEDIYDQMQGDQPGTPGNLTGGVNLTEYIQTTKNRQREVDVDDRAKDNWIQVLKENILRQIGRSNMTRTKPENVRIDAMNMTMLPGIFNGTAFEDDHITEKIRSYYPSCEAPINMEQDMWREENVMNLYFNNFDQSTDERGLSIATATLRLYRVPIVNATKATGKSPDCDSSTSEEDRLLRVSIYWYTRSKKKRVKRRLSDSKVIPENARWVELSVKPAARAWSRGRNLGLAVVVEDQEGNSLKADRFFKGALCMVGASTPKPIPTIIVDAARQSNELDQRIHSLFGRNSTASLSGDVSMLPTIDVCTLEFPENYSRSPSEIGDLRINACNLKRSYDQTRMLAERDRLERLATLPELLSPRHIRHQRQHLKLNDFDVRSKIINKRILTNDELKALNITVNR